MGSISSIDLVYILLGREILKIKKPCLAYELLAGSSD